MPEKSRGKKKRIADTARVNALLVHILSVYIFFCVYFSVMHHPASGISFPRNFVCLQITKTCHSHLISHMSVRLFLHHHCHPPLLLLTSTPDSKLIFFKNLFLHSSSTFPPTGLTPQTPGVFVFLGHVGFNFGIVC